MKNVIAETDIIETLVSEIKRDFPRAKKNSFNNDEDLFDKGIIDSMGLLSIIGFIESEYSITVADEDVIPDNFSSIDAMRKYILRHLPDK